MCLPHVYLHMARERAETGEFVETVTLDRVVSAIRAVDGPVVTTRDVGDRLDCTTEAARQKLVHLTEQGRVDRRKVGGRAVVWWLTESGDATDEFDPDDPLFTDTATFSREDPADVSRNTDEYLAEAIADEHDDE